MMLNTLQKAVQFSTRSPLGAPQDLPRQNPAASMQREQQAMQRNSLIRCNHHTLAHHTQVLLQALLAEHMDGSASAG